MCGIFGYIGKKSNAAEIVFAGLKTLEYRGYDSWGIAVLGKKTHVADIIEKQKTENKLIILKKKTGQIGQTNVSDLPGSNFALGHTRWATHGGVTELNAHPHLDCTGQFALIHNGIIENYDEIKKKLEDSGHKFLSETDTEVAVHLIEENYRQIEAKTDKERFLEAVRLSFRQFVGLNAIIVMDSRSSIFVAVKTGSPLVVGKGEGENFLCSDAHALLPYTREVYFMEDGELVVVSAKEISVSTLENKRKISPKFIHVSWKKTIAEKGKFPHFMLKEIYDQPKVIETIMTEGQEQVERLATLIKNSYGTYLVGCGTAAYACLAATYLFSKFAKRHINFAVASEFGYMVDFLTSKSLVLALSQSGETIDVIEAVRKAKEKKAQIGALVNVLGSTLYRLADFKLLLGAGTETAVVCTKAFTSKLAYLILTAHQLAGNREKGLADLNKAVIAIGEILTEKNLQKIRDLASFISNSQHIYVIGRGLSYPIALETALKIKEASYIHAEGFAAGELKHGVIALVEKGSPSVVFLPNDETYGANLAGAMEMKARGGYIIGVSYKPHHLFDYYLEVKDCGTASIIPSVVIGQLLGYFLAIEKGINPDKPRNLAKSVTVK